MDINFDVNTVTIYGNVVFEGQLNFKSVRGGSPTPVFGQIDITYRTERMKLYQD